LKLIISLQRVLYNMARINNNYHTSKVKDDTKFTHTLLIINSVMTLVLLLLNLRK
jgi:hypothetical protein